MKCFHWKHNARVKQTEYIIFFSTWEKQLLRILLSVILVNHSNYSIVLSEIKVNLQIYHKIGERIRIMDFYI